MHNKAHFILCVLLLLLVGAGASFAVTVPGYDGTQLALSQIPDIIRHVTGQTSGDLHLKKDTLFMYGVRSGDHEAMDFYSFKDDGSNDHLASVSSGAYNPASYNYSQISALNTSTKLDDRGKLLLLYIENGSIKGRGACVSTDHSGAASIEYRNRYHTTGTNNGYLVDSKSGIKVKGYDGELVAFLRRNGETINLNLGKFYISPYSNQAIAQTDLLSASWSATTGDSGNVPKMLDGTIYFPLSMAVGDFDNDGYTNEIVVVDTNMIAIHYHVLRITHTGSSPTDASFTISVLNNGDVSAYGYGSRNDYKGRYLNMDGISCTYSHCVVAGDFDGDGKTEFAVIYRDTSPQNDIFTQDFASSYSLFVGYTGKIHVKTYKWNGSVFQTEEHVKGFDIYQYNSDRYNEWHDLDLPLGVKAAVGDFDGDGRDDIAVLRVMLQYTEHYMYYHDSTDFYYSNFVFGAFVDWYTFDYGSIKPKYNAHNWGAHPWNYGDNRNGWVGIRTTDINMGMFMDRGISETDTSQGNQNKIRQQYYLAPITGEQTPYPVIDREFDIIAGKFTGTVGKATTRDELVIKYPQWTSGSGNKMRSHVVLMTNIPGVTNWGTQVYEITSLSDRDHLLAFAKADYLDESLTLGDPVKITDTTDMDYTAVLQMFPYHIDNLTSDGSALTKDPQNFTLRLDTSVTYSNTFTSSDTSNLTYSMTKTAETIFALDCSALRTVSKTFQGIRGIMTAGIGSNDVINKVGTIGKIWDKLKDTVQTTTSKSNEHSQSYNITITTQANYQDTLYMNKSSRYLWRYPVMEIPAPAWLMGQTRDTLGSFDESQVVNQQSYITFAMSEPLTPVSSVGVNDSYYQPYHERGNLFSYPVALEQVEGYKGGKSIADKGPREWDGAAYEEIISLTKTVTSQDSTKKVNKAGAITKFLSVIDNIFGSSLAHIPQNSESSFTRSVTNGESIKINLPAAYSGAGFTALFDTYLDAAGTMTTAFAVKNFNRDDALWSKKSLYSLKPDPSLLLPEKFNYSSISGSDFDRAAFTVNNNDDTAIKMRGTRFTLADYDIDTDNLLMKGLTYTISVPVYNASFKDADNLKVRLSYAKTNDFDATKTKIGDYTFTKLPGWGNGNSRQDATFTWTPASMDEGIYYLFAEIDPENKIDEVHENRRDAKGNLIDAGGNNLGYWRVGIAASDSPIFDRNQLENAEFYAADSEGFVFPYVHWVKADSLDLEDFIKQKVDGATEPVPAEVELKYGGEYLMTQAHLVGYKLKPEAKGKDISEITDADIGLVFVDAKFVFFPGEDHKLHFRINPAYLEDGIGFVLHVHGKEYPLTDIIYGSAGSNSGIRSSSGGCYSGFGLMAGIGAFFVLMRRKR